MLRSLKSGKLAVEIYSTRDEMGKAAAVSVAEKIQYVLGHKQEVNIVFAAAPSQVELYHHLIESDIDFSNVNAFHMDEYIGLSSDAPQSFANYLRGNLFSKMPFKSINYINSQASDPEAECERYAKLLAEMPPDIICHGIGENGHLAFNDPPTADVDDPVDVKVVNMDDICRNQQVNDGCFAHINEVPKSAITITLPILTKRTAHLIVVVPGPTKIDAVTATIKGEISTTCPASVLRLHNDATLFLDEVAAMHV